MAVEKAYPGHPALTGGGETSLHSHAGDGGGANVKSGVVTAVAGSNNVTFNTAFASTPRVVLTVRDPSLALRDALYVIRSVSTTGFTFDADAYAVYAWIATDAGDP